MSMDDSEACGRGGTRALGAAVDELMLPTPQKCLHTAIKSLEVRKKKEKVLREAREQTKQNFEKVQNQPGLKEMQEKIDE